MDTEIVMDQQHQLKVYKSVGLGGIHARVLKNLVNVLAGLLSIIYESVGSLRRSFLKLTDIITIYKEGMTVANYSLTSPP